MDWFSWLSKTGLEPSLVYEYGLTFTQNELEHQDITYFNHEFLQSMGISIAKHRLEILKLATKQNYTNTPNHHISKIFITIKRTTTRFSKFFRALISREDSGLAIMAKPDYSARWKINNARIKRKKKLIVVNSCNNYKHSKEPLLITNGIPLMFPTSRISSFSSPFVQRDHDQKIEGDYKNYDDQYRPCGGEEIRWDSMFQNLNPT